MDLNVEVLGQLELVESLQTGHLHFSHLISIGNPKQILRRSRPDEMMPRQFGSHFTRILRLEFFDVEDRRHLRRWQFPKTIPNRAHVRKVIRFYEQTRERANGYTIQCWQGISRSTGIALGLLYMICGSEVGARAALRKIRPEAIPNHRIVAFFDKELGCDLSAANEEIRKERIDTWKKELDLIEESALEELPVVSEDTTD